MTFEELNTLISYHLLQKYNVEGIGYVLTGSRAYGVSLPTSDYDVIGIHISSEILEHPKYRKPWEVLSAQPSENLSIVSYEAWKYLEMLQNGAFTAYEIRTLPVIGLGMYANFWTSVRRQTAIPTGSFYSALGNYRSDTISKIKKGERKGILMGYYRLIQAYKALKEGIFVTNLPALFNWYHEEVYNIQAGLNLLLDHMEPKLRNQPISDTRFLNELVLIERLLAQSVKAQDAHSYPRDGLENMLKALKRDRIALIQKDIKK